MVIVYLNCYRYVCMWTPRVELKISMKVQENASCTHNLVGLEDDNTIIILLLNELSLHLLLTVTHRLETPSQCL